MQESLGRNQSIRAECSSAWRYVVVVVIFSLDVISPDVVGLTFHFTGTNQLVSHAEIPRQWNGRRLIGGTGVICPPPIGIFPGNCSLLEFVDGKLNVDQLDQMTAK